MARRARHCSWPPLCQSARSARPAEGVRLIAAAPFRWIAPQILRPDDRAPARNRLLMWSDEFIRLPRVTVHQGGRLLARRTLAWPAAPGRAFRVPSSVLRGVSPAHGPVHIGLEQAGTRA
ncbi:hypothetical protein AB0G77_24320 [Streptomyces hygroscopicus]|uniref:hypothetical protein n=1 Tax=Streptomyces hygroscopicus TaxID=1912 RepID=UPI0033F28E58